MPRAQPAPLNESSPVSLASKAEGKISPEQPPFTPRRRSRCALAPGLSTPKTTWSVYAERRSTRLRSCAEWSGSSAGGPGSRITGCSQGSWCPWRRSSARPIPHGVPSMARRAHRLYRSHRGAWLPPVRRSSPDRERRSAARLSKQLQLVTDGVGGRPRECVTGAARRPAKTHPPAAGPRTRGRRRALRRPARRCWTPSSCGSP